MWEWIRSFQILWLLRDPSAQVIRNHEVDMFADNRYIEPASQDILDPSLFYLYDGFEQPTVSVPVWRAKPINYPPTCRLDKAFLDLVKTLRPLNAVGGNAIEFSDPKFPQVSALLNPQHHSAAYPLTTAIVLVCRVLVIRGKRSADHIRM